jgi:hypothetical protein
MQFVVTHLTRMREGICTAGPEVRSGAIIRPVAKHGSLPASLLWRKGGPLKVGALVNIGTGVPRPVPPHSEDIEADPAEWHMAGQVSEERFLKHLLGHTAPSPHAAFGQPMREVEPGKYALTAGGGDHSLAYVLLDRGLELTVTDGGRLSLQFVAERRRFRLPVTDARLYKDDLATPDPTAAGRLQKLLWHGQGVVIGMGIGRAWGRPGEEPMHWLQANNLYPVEAPYWDEPRPLMQKYGSPFPAHAVLSAR